MQKTLTMSEQYKVYDPDAAYFITFTLCSRASFLQTRAGIAMIFLPAKL